MKLISSSPKSRHTHTAAPQRGWYLKQIRSRYFKARYVAPVAWIMLVVIVGITAITVIHILRQMLELTSGQ